MADDPLLTAAGHIADGDAVDWGVISGSLSTDRDRALAHELAVVQQIALGHQQLHQLLPVVADRPSNVIPDRARWGHLDLLNIVGRGSYGVVYRAWDTRLERLVALKLFHGATDPDAVLQEGRMLARVRHENVVTVYGADLIDGVAGIWMELVHGETLDQIVRKQGPLPAREAAAIGADVARALGAIHEAALLHCDVKAQNVVREKSGRVVLMDLGAGRLAPEARDSDQLSDVAGTPRYMAPELFKAGALPTKASDVYSLGVLLFYLVSGTFPVDGKTLGELKRAHEDAHRRSLRDVRPDASPGFAATVERALSADAEARPGADEYQSSLRRLAEDVAPRRAPIIFWAAAALAATLLAAGAIQTWRSRPGVAPATRTIAVMPIEVAGSDPSEKYLADGLTEVVISSLSRVTSLRVPSFAAVTSAQQPGIDPSSQARRMGADLVVTASLAELPSGLGLALKVFNRDAAVVWQGTVTADRTNALALAPAVLRSLKQPLGLDIGSRAEQAVDPRAQTAYFRGLTLARQGLRQIRESIGLFRHATELEPGFAAAWAELALAESVDVNQPDAAAAAAHRARVRDAADRAMALDPTLGASYAAVANEQFYNQWDFAAAERTFRKALDVEPSYVFARQRLAMLLAALGRLDEAIDLARECQALEPLYPIRTEVLGTLYYYRRDYDQAITQMQRSIELSSRVESRSSESAHYGLARIFSAIGRHDDAVREVKESLVDNRISSYLAEMARIYVAAGRRDDAEAVMREVSQREQQGDRISPDRRAYLLAADGRIDEAFAALQLARDQRNPNFLWIAVDPRADPLRDDPRFDALLRDIGLVH